jgi:hypothetical protein
LVSDLLLVLVLSSLLLALSLSVRCLRLGSRLRRAFASARIFGSARTLGTALASSVLVLSSLRLAVLAGTHFFWPVFVGFRFLSAWDSSPSLGLCCTWLLSLSQPATLTFVVYLWPSFLTCVSGLVAFCDLQSGLWFACLLLTNNLRERFLYVGSLDFYWIVANSCSSTIVLLAFAVNVPWIYLCLLLTDEYKMVSISGCWGRSFWKLLVFLQLFELPPGRCRWNDSMCAMFNIALIFMVMVFVIEC